MTRIRSSISSAGISSGAVSQKTFSFLLAIVCTLALTLGIVACDSENAWRIQVTEARTT